MVTAGLLVTAADRRGDHVGTASAATEAAPFVVGLQVRSPVVLTGAGGDAAEVPFRVTVSHPDGVAAVAVRLTAPGGAQDRRVRLTRLADDGVESTWAGLTRFPAHARTGLYGMVLTVETRRGEQVTSAQPFLPVQRAAVPTPPGPASGG